MSKWNVLGANFDSTFNWIVFRFVIWLVVQRVHLANLRNSGIFFLKYLIQNCPFIWFLSVCFSEFWLNFVNRVMKDTYLFVVWASIHHYFGWEKIHKTDKESKKREQKQFETELVFSVLKDNPYNLSVNTFTKALEKTEKKSNSEHNERKANESFPLEFWILYLSMLLPVAARQCSNVSSTQVFHIFFLNI